MTCLTVELALTPPLAVELALAGPAALTLDLGVQGPPGPPGPTGPAGAISHHYTATQATGGQRLVRSDGAGGIGYASSDDLAGVLGLLGLTLNAAAPGDALAVMAMGEADEGSWSWTPGMPVFLGLNGVPTQVLPPTALFSWVIGFPLTPTKLFIAPREPVIFP